ncbi:MAG: oligosaccharide flippase family protein [Chloroflexota bacterium]|nr:oligosaccharide flippase family protein [Chloroflexota bacterium]
MAHLGRTTCATACTSRSGNRSCVTLTRADRANTDALIRRRLFGGSISNALARVIGLLSWFVLAPIILARLGPSQYGLWVVVGSIVGYGWLLDFGISATLVKYLAQFRAQGQIDRARALIATSLCLYSALGLLAALVSAGLAVVLPGLLNVPEEDRATAAWVVLIMGLAVGVGLPCSTGLAVLRGLHRYDLASLVAAAATLISAVCIVVVLFTGGGLIGMVAVSVPVALATQATAWWLIRRIAPELGLTWRGATWQLARTTAAYGTPLSVMDVADILQRKTDEVVIGAFLPVASVTPFVLARGLAEVGRTLTSQFVQVLLPVASELQARNDLGRLRALYLNATRVSLVIFVPIGVTLFVFPRQILTAWVGAGQADAAQLVVILTVASMLVTSQSPARWILQGIARHRLLAVAALASGLGNLALSVALVRPLGVTGVAVGTLVPMAVESMCFVLPFAMRLLDVRAGQWLREIALPAVAPVVPQALALYLLDRVFAPDALLTLALTAMAGWLVYVGSYLALGASPAERALCRRLILRGAPS